MIGLDTNVLVRYLAQDDPKQALAATRFVEKSLSASQPGFISLVVLVEVCWVLRSLYSATDAELASTVQDMLAAVQFHVDHRDAVQAVVQKMTAAKPPSAGFADLLVAELAKAAGCSHTVTFDKKAVRSAGMKLLV